MKNLELIPIKRLLRDDSDSPREFVIPAYQRGYRWKRPQVKQLLDDISEYAENPVTPFYCLQPLVVKEATAHSVEVVDGQQRLTTIFLILHHLNQGYEEPRRHRLFSIEVANRRDDRKDIGTFLNSDNRSEEAEKDIDFYHINEAADQIEKWFTSRRAELSLIEYHLLYRCKVIWYALSDDDEPLEVFARLNVGKIPLTSTELIRGMILSDSANAEGGSEERQLRTALEWDSIEKVFGNAAFWYFLGNREEPDHDRIHFLFELVVDGSGSAQSRNDGLDLFHQFSRMIEAEGQERDRCAQEVWEKARRTFARLEAWFECRILRHLIGFLLQKPTTDAARKKTARSLLKLAEAQSKSKFREGLMNNIFLEVFGESLDPSDEDGRRTWLEGLRYKGENHTFIQPVLLLFNIATLLENAESGIDFPFEHYVKQAWNLEHIRANREAEPGNRGAQIEWLEGVKGYLDSAPEGKESAEKEMPAEELKEKIVKFVAGKDAGSNFSQLFEEVLEHLDRANSEEPHSLLNLTLLDESTNKGIGNLPFASKRVKILELDRSGGFVPTCTRNVFLKAYTLDAANPYRWTKGDGDRHLEEIIERLNHFFKDSVS